RGNEKVTECVEWSPRHRRRAVRRTCPMPDEIAPAPAGRMPALAVVCVLAAVSVVVAFLGATPTRVSAGELLGEPRSPGERAFVAAHRGGASEGPENTLPAVSAALANAYDYVEVDVALTRDGVP